MKLGIYAIRDNVAVQVSAPKVMVNDLVAERDFRITVKVNVEDYDLIKCGEYDNESGQIIPAAAPIVLLKGASIKAGE